MDKKRNGKSLMKRLLAVSLILSIFTAVVSAQTNLTVLVNFNGTNGSWPYCDLVQGSDGNLYGTTYYGGNLLLNSGTGYGSVFKVTLGGTLTTLTNFNFTNGAEPYAGVVQGNDGNFYGTTQLGGTNGNNGTLYRITTNGTLTTMVYFNLTNGGSPYAPLLLAADGNFYGTTASGTAGTNDGTIFKFSTNSGLTTLAAFNGTDGEAPYAGLTQGTNGLFYGTTTTGGFDGYGIVYSVTTNGNLSTVEEFEPPSPSPANPYGSLAYGSDGFLYGTTDGGGSNHDGTIFKVVGGGSTNVVNFNGTNGTSPDGRLLLANDGNLYGMANLGGSANDGTIFELDTSGTLTTLVTFTNTNGRLPSAGLLQASDGNFYGVTRLGGTYGLGTLFRLSPPPSSRAPHIFLTLVGTNVVLRWPESAADYTLQFTSNLPSSGWSNVVSQATLISNEYVFTNPIIGTSTFFRLIQ